MSIRHICYYFLLTALCFVFPAFYGFPRAFLYSTFSPLSGHSLYFFLSFYFLSDGPRLYDMHLQLIQVHFSDNMIPAHGSAGASQQGSLDCSSPPLGLFLPFILLFQKSNPRPVLRRCPCLSISNASFSPRFLPEA